MMAAIAARNAPENMTIYTGMVCCASLKNLARIIIRSFHCWQSKLEPQLDVDLPVVSSRISKRAKSGQTPVRSEEGRRQISARRRKVGAVQGVARGDAQRQVVFLAALRAEHAGRRTSTRHATRGHAATSCAT